MSEDGADKEAEMTRLILMMAGSFQGGHSRTGGEVADFLGIPFPLTMKSLEKAAKARGLDAADLWPWLIEMRAKRATKEPSNVE